MPYSHSHSQSHRFHLGNSHGERNTRWAVYLTAVMMVAEIVGGWWFGSMALLADGWHMSSHTLALGLTVLAYWLSRKYAHDGRFSMGTWKIEILAAYTSAIALFGIAGLMIFQSVERLVAPTAIHYQEAIGIAILGLLVNLICARLLHEGHGHEHHGEHVHSHDLNLKAAYIHVLTDAATSVFAILALLSGWFWGAAWMDPAMGILGALLVAWWAIGLLKETSKILVDAEMDAPVVEEIQQAIQAGDPQAEITDLHVWRVTKDTYACMVSLSTISDRNSDYYRKLIQVHEEVIHVTIEVNHREICTIEP